MRSFTTRDANQDNDLAAESAELAAQGSLTEHQFLRAAAFDAITYFVGAATLYFVFIIGLLFYTAPPDTLAILIPQKCAYTLVLAVLLARLRRHSISPIYFNTLLNLILFLCLSSTLVTAACGIVSRAGTYSLILILAGALVEISFLGASLRWAVVWIAWLVAATSMLPAQRLEDLAKLLGVQLIAVAAMSLRLRLYKRHFRTLNRLAEALRGSEQVRASLDREVDTRTAELKTAYQDLSSSIEETERITQEQDRLREQLLQSQKMESLGRLAGGVAHDFNNLLTVIIGSLELARTTQALPPEIDELLHDSGIAAQRAAELTGQLLAFSRKQVLTIEPFRIQETVESALKLAQRLLGEDIELRPILECPGAMVDGDAGQIQQVLLNLVINARDAMPDGGILTVSLSATQKEIELVVSDTGQGIAPELHDSIFEPFFTSKPMGSGTGLGLATVHGIVSKHKGEITVKSTPGHGAAFSVTLPLSEASQTLAQTTRSLAGNAVTEKVLLVEDDDQVRRLAVRCLRSAGYLVDHFNSAEAALKALDPSSHYDLLLTDVVMPGMDGGRLAEEVRRLRPQLPVLFMSGYTDDRLSPLGILRRPDCAFLSKPFTPQSLREAVEDVLAPSKA